MLYSHRVYFKGLVAPIGFNTGLTLVGLVEQHSEDNVIYIEDMLMKPWLDECMKAMQAGITMGTDGIFFSYIEEDTYSVVDPALDPWNRDNHTENEMSIRRRLQSFYKKNPEAMDEDKLYIELYRSGDIIQSC